MKHLVLIVHANFQSELADILRSIDVIGGFTLTAVEGHGAQSEDDQFLSTRDKVVGYTPHIRVDVILKQTDLSAVLKALRKSNINLTGHNVYWVTNIEEFNRL